MQYSHLHNHTQFSLLDGAIAIPQMYKKAERDGMPAVAITDHGNMFGVFQFVAEAWKNTKVVGKTSEGKELLEPVVKPIVGCEFYLVADRTQQVFTKTAKDKRYHQLFLAKDEEGYRNLTKMCSLGYMEGLYGKYPRIDKELVAKYHKGLIATTCCLGASVPQAILHRGEAEAEIEFKWWLDLFGDDFYVELQRHDIPDQNTVNEVLLRFAEKYDVPVIASNDSHYLDKEDADAHDILLCVNTGQYKSTPATKEFSGDGQKPKDTRFAFYNDEFYFKTTEEMSKTFADLPQAIDNTQQIVDKIKPLKLEKDILLPNFVVPPAFNNDQNAYLEHLTWTGARERYKELSPEIEERIRFELFTISTMGFAGYFLIVSDFIKAGRDMGVFIGPGRGSAAGSVVAYAIGITNIDPIKYNLLFERFLNPDRKEMPDIDTDFDDAGRQKVIDYVVDKYGKNQVAQIITYGTMAAKSSIKDVARVMELPLSQSNMLAKLVPDLPGVSLQRVLRAPLTQSTPDMKSLKDKEELRDEDMANVAALRKYLEGAGLEAEVLRQAEKLEGTVRNTGIHAAGIIIAPSDLSDLIPVSMVKDNMLLVTQYEGKVIEKSGVIKMDFLGLKNLTILKDALRMIQENHGVAIDLDALPLDDAKTFALYQEGNTNGTFQFESVGMQRYLRELKPDKFADLIAMNALYRPGPIAYIPNFIDRKHGREPISYDLPEMEEYLADTYGITVYQEQVMLLSQKLAGFSKGDADKLRKAMGKKQLAVLDQLYEKFKEGMATNGHDAKIADKIWTDWKAFAQYAFNKSHSTCYAVVAYQTSYLKAHYPSEYMAGVLNSQKDIQKITFYIAEAKRMGIEILPPHINESQAGFSVNKEGNIRFGMAAINGVGHIAVDDLVAERDANGPYADIHDVVMRVNQRTVNKKSLEGLAYAGAFDCFEHTHRAQYFAPVGDGQTVIDAAIRFGGQYQSDKMNLGNSLFGDTEMPQVAPPAIPTAAVWSLVEKLQYEKQVLGFYLSGHPLDNYAFEIAHYNITPIADLGSRIGKKVRIAGMLSDCVERQSQKGDLYGICTINDGDESLKLFFYGKNFVDYGKFLINENRVLIEGYYEPHKFIPDRIDLNYTNIVLLSDVLPTLTSTLRVRATLQQLDHSPKLEELCTLLAAEEGPTKFLLEIDGEGAYDHQDIVMVREHPGILMSGAIVEQLEASGLQYLVNTN